MLTRPTNDQSLEYQRDMLRQLVEMAQASRCDMLAYLIEMAYVECCDTIRERHAARQEVSKQAA